MTSSRLAADFKSVARRTQSRVSLRPALVGRAGVRHAAPPNLVGAGMRLISRYQPYASLYRESSIAIGPKAQVGVNASLGRGWFPNTDIKWVWSPPDRRFEGTKVSTLKLDEFVDRIGIAYRFGNSVR